jgi:hypothetical protein
VAHNQRKNHGRPPKETIDGDEEYTYPTKKAKQGAKSRRNDQDHIQAGLDEFENPEEEEGEWYDSDEPSQEQINVDDYNQTLDDDDSARLIWDDADLDSYWDERDYR